MILMSVYPACAKLFWICWANWLILGLSVASLITLSLALVAAVLSPGFWGVGFWASHAKC
jgi:hypothetical protein